MMQCKDSSKIRKFHLISWCENFKGMQSFCRAWGDFLTKLCGDCAFRQNFHTRNFGENMVFYAMYVGYFLSLLTLSVLQRDQRYYKKLPWIR